MKVLVLVRFVLKMVGALPTLAHAKLYRIYGFLILFVMTANLYAYFLAFITKWNNVSIFLQTMAMSMGAFSAVAKSSTFVFSHKTFKTILDGIQEILDKSEKDNRMKQYEKYSKIERNYSRLYGVFMLSSAQTIWIGPLLSVLYGVYKDEYHIRYPCEVVYLLREESVWEYICFFSFSALNIQLNASFLFVADAGFIGINLYLIAAFADLNDNFREIEQITSERSQKHNFVSCVNFHRNLLRLLNALQDLYNPIIFFQFFMSCLQICAITLELLLHEHITWDRFVQVLPVYPTILAILFIYCKFGNDLSIKTSEVSMAIYNSEWYSYPLKLQKLTPTIIQRAQKPEVITGFKLFACTLENYTKALNKVGSMLTIMRQLLNK